MTDFENARDYFTAAREMASHANERDPQFTDKEKLNLEIYAEGLNDSIARQELLECAQGKSSAHNYEVEISHTR
jgi:hypothetical protein